MDLTEMGMAVSLLSVSFAVLKMNWNGKGKSTNHSSTENSRRIDAVKLQKDLSERPTFKDADERFMNSKLCNQLHQQINNSLACLPEMKETLIKIKTKMKIGD